MAKGKSSTSGGKRTTKASVAPPPESYLHPTAEALLHPDVRTQAQFKEKKLPKMYRYDSSLSPEPNWHGNPAHGIGIRRKTSRPTLPRFASQAR